MPPADEDARRDRANARVGRTVGKKWRLDALLGIGGMAAVYAATHRNGRPVAVKILHPELSLDDAVRARLLREGWLANTIGHEGVVAILDDGIDDEDDTVFLVMERLEGETLEERLRRADGVLPVDAAVRITEALLDVLVAAHAKGVIHRDLKPANVFLTKEGGLKVLDFGLARGALSADAATSGGDAGPSLHGVVGTPSYMAPEQARGLWENVDARTDVWAVAAILFRMIAGRPVHGGRTVAEVLLAAMTKRAPSLGEVMKDVPRAVVDACDRALAFDRASRFGDAASMRDALRGAHGVKGSPALRRDAKRSRAAISFAIAVVAVAWLGARWARSGASDARAEAPSPSAVVPRAPDAPAASASAAIAPSAPSEPAVIAPPSSPKGASIATPDAIGSSRPPRVAIAPSVVRPGASALPSAAVAPSSTTAPVETPEGIPSVLLDRRR